MGASGVSADARLGGYDSERMSVRVGAHVDLLVIAELLTLRERLPLLFCSLEITSRYLRANRLASTASSSRSDPRFSSSRPNTWISRPKGQCIEVPASSVRKRFKPGDHIKVMAHETGLVVSVVNNAVTLWSDSTLR